MATLVTNDFDTFEITQSQGAPMLPANTVQVPHALARVFRRAAQFESSVARVLTNNNVANSLGGQRVSLIKYLRETIKDPKGGWIGLRDAKDIVDHYYETRDAV